MSNPGAEKDSLIVCSSNGSVHRRAHGKSSQRRANVESRRISSLNQFSTHSKSSQTLGAR
eukprot:5785039-Prymnesium_polylepis.1